MPRAVWEFIEHNGGLLSESDLPNEQRAKLDNVLLKMETAEVAPGGKVHLPTKMLAGPGIHGQRGIYKLRVSGNQALRVMVCLGPMEPAQRWTALSMTAKKDNDTSSEKVAARSAATRMAQLAAGTATSREYRPKRKL
jgi:hypothetical protein